MKLLTVLYLVSVTSINLLAALKSTIWRLDTHHDGYIYLPSYLAQYGHLPPEFPKTVYGIAQPVLESIFLNFIGKGFIKYRIIALLLIVGCTYLIYKIITSYRVIKKLAILFELIWASANTIWAQA